MILTDEKGTTLLELLLGGVISALALMAMWVGHQSSRELDTIREEKVLADISASELIEYFRSLNPAALKSHLTSYRLCDGINVRVGTEITNPDPIAAVGDIPFRGFLSRFYHVQIVDGATLATKPNFCGQYPSSATFDASDRFYLTVGISWIGQNGVERAVLSTLIPGAIAMLPAPSPTPSSIPSPSPSPGVTDHLIFASSQTYRGNLGGIQGAHDKCTALASARGLRPGRPWKAILADGTTHPSSFISISGPVLNMRNVAIENTSDLYSNNTALAAIGYTEENESYTSNIRAWTGLLEGTTGRMDNSTNHCLGWTSSSSSQLGETGDTTATSGWLRDEAKTCDSYRRLICISQ